MQILTELEQICSWVIARCVVKEFRKVRNGKWNDKIGHGSYFHTLIMK